jgi:hypothetical protein
MGDVTDLCARCHHRRGLHRPAGGKGSSGCHYLGAHGGPDKVCGGSASEGPYRGSRCEAFVEPEQVS